MLGFESLREAKAAYLMHFDNPKFLGSVSETDIDTFKQAFVHKSLLAGIPDVDPAAVSQVPPTESMMPASPMMGMFPPPIDPETYEGVNALLGRIGSCKDNELMQIASDIWGSAVTFEGQQPEQARSEIVGFLLDQRDLLGVMPEQPSFEPSPSLPTLAPSGSSDYSNVSRTSPTVSNAQPPEGNSFGGGSQTQPSMGLFGQGFYKRPDVLA